MATSILSRRWKLVWVALHNLCFDDGLRLWHAALTPAGVSRFEGFVDIVVGETQLRLIYKFFQSNFFVRIRFMGFFYHDVQYAWDWSWCLGLRMHWINHMYLHFLYTWSSSTWFKFCAQSSSYCYVFSKVEDSSSYYGISWLHRDGEAISYFPITWRANYSGFFECYTIAYSLTTTKFLFVSESIMLVCFL